jgi:ABC-type antimicrobial peptide transport system permease subunit
VPGIVSKTPNMFRNYFIITLRNLFKNKVYSFINIAGLAIGITCSLLILLWVNDELSFDKFHPKSDRLFQVWVNSQFDGRMNTWNSVPLPAYEAMKTANANIVNSVVYDWGENHLLTVGEKRITKKAHFASEEFLEMFEFPLVKGIATQVMDDPTSIVITESTAKALFGDEDPMNQMIRVDDKADLKVTGILKDLPKNSSLEFDFLMTWRMNEQLEPWVVRNKTNWGNYSFQVSVELKNGQTEADVENAIRDLLTKNGQTDLKREFFLHPMERWRLYSDFDEGKEGGMIDYVQLFTVIAIFILAIACINFMNLATARSERRAREVGIRKSVGSKRSELIFQFIGESLFIAFIACVIAVLLTELSLPFYNDLVQKKLAIDYTAKEFWLFTVGLVFFTGFVSGSYPAFYLSSFQPVKVLKGKVSVGKGASTPRKILVTLQFGFSILLIIGTIVIFQQIQLVKNRDLGYAQENLIGVGYTAELGKNYKSLTEELLHSGAVSAVTRSNSPITNIYSNNFLGWPGKPEDHKVIFATIATGLDYTKTMGIKLLEGRDFSEEFKSDSAAIIVNKAAIDIMQLKDPIGQQLDLGDEKRELIGIVDNVLMGDPYASVGPMFFVLEPEWVSTITVRLEKTSDIQASLKTVGDIFKKYNPAYPFEYAFADVEFGKKFQTINMTSDLATLFAALTIIITGLGLFGLSAFTAEQRTKELGIRKVLGASVPSLIGLMNKDFSKLVLMAFIISAPAAWWLLTSYLERYPVRITIAWWIFPLTGLVALTFALLIVTTQAIKAASANPVNSLRNE